MLIMPKHRSINALYGYGNYFSRNIKTGPTKMDDIKLLEAVERYLAADRTPDERSAFDNMRNINPEIDQLVVEHSFFLQQINRFEDVTSFKSKLSDTHLRLTEKGGIVSPEPRGKAKIVHLFNRYKRTAAIAASIAGITA